MHEHLWRYVGSWTSVFSRETPRCRAMELIVRSLAGSTKLSEVSASLDVSGLKELILQSSGITAVPACTKQRLVFRDKVLQQGTLRDAGMQDGDCIVLVSPMPWAAPEDIDTTPVPNISSIKAAIIAEAKNRGIESQMKRDAPPTSRSGREYGLPELMEMDGQLMQLIEALGGRLSASRGAGGLEAALLSGLTSGALGMSSQPAATNRAAAPPPPLVIPEPSTEGLAQLSEMGFGDDVCRKALLLHRNDVAVALDWLLQHGEEAEAATPLTPSQLQQIYGVRPAAVASEADMVGQLVEMGFTSEQARGALRRYRNMDLALAHLLRHADRPASTVAASADGGSSSTSGRPATAAGSPRPALASLAAAAAAAAAHAGPSGSTSDAPRSIGGGGSSDAAAAEAGNRGSVSTLQRLQAGVSVADANTATAAAQHDSDHATQVHGEDEHVEDEENGDDEYEAEEYEDEEDEEVDDEDEDEEEDEGAEGLEEEEDVELGALHHLMHGGNEVFLVPGQGDEDHGAADNMMSLAAMYGGGDWVGTQSVAERLQQLSQQQELHAAIASNWRQESETAGEDAEPGSHAV